MATNNAVDVGLSGSTGTGNFVGATSPTLVTPTLGAATATTVAFSPTTGGIIGTTAADSASAGNVGQILSVIVNKASAISMSNGVTNTIATLSLTAGDWDVWGDVWANPAGTTTINAMDGAINTATSLPTDTSLNSTLVQIAGLSSAAGVAQLIPVSICQINISTTTNVFLLANINFLVSTLSAYGRIIARRRR